MSAIVDRGHEDEIKCVCTNSKRSCENIKVVYEVVKQMASRMQARQGEQGGRESLERPREEEEERRRERTDGRY